MTECKRILVVDDDELIREALKELLEIKGYSVSTATTGQEALNLIDRPSNIGLIILDLMMPVMDGQTFINIQQKNGNPVKIPIVVLSGISDQVNIPGVLKCLKKPVDLQSLLKIIEQTCGSSL